MGKRAEKKMSIAEFTGGDTGQTLPTSSTGKDFAKSKGKGLRESEDSRAEMGEWRGGGGKGGGGGFGDREGGGKGGGFGRGGRRGDDGPSRADEGDWFSRDAPAGGDREDRRGGRDRDGDRGGDRDGDRGGRRQSTRNFEDRDTAASKDDDWRGGDRDRGGDDRRGFRDRDRDGGRDGGGFGDRRRSQNESRGDGDWGRGGGDRDRDRGGDRDRRGGDAFGEDRKAAAPWRSKRAQDGDDDEGKKDEDGFESLRKGGSTAGKYVPPSQRNRVKEEPRERDEEDRRDRRKEEDERRQRDDEDKEARRSAAKEKNSGGAYVTPAKRAQMEKEEKERGQREAREAVQKKQKEKEEAEKEARRKEKEARKREEKEEYLKEKKAAAEKARIPRAQKKEDDDDYDKDRLDEFSEKCSAVVCEGADAHELAEDVEEYLGQEELKTLHPVKALCQHLLTHCRRKKDEEVIEAVKNAAPIFKTLIDLAQIHRYKVKMLCEIQRICSNMGLPRLSPESALLEVFLDGLYQAEIVEEGYFDMWAIADDDTPGKTTAMFQVNHFLDWLREAGIEGDTSDSDSEDDEDKSDSDDDDDLAAYDNAYGSRAR